MRSGTFYSIQLRLFLGPFVPSLFHLRCWTFYILEYLRVNIEFLFCGLSKISSFSLPVRRRLPHSPQWGESVEVKHGPFGLMQVAVRRKI